MKKTFRLLCITVLATTIATTSVTAGAKFEVDPFNAHKIEGENYVAKAVFDGILIENETTNKAQYSTQNKVPGTLIMDQTFSNTANSEKFFADALNGAIYSYQWHHGIPNYMNAPLADTIMYGGANKQVMHQFGTSINDYKLRTVAFAGDPKENYYFSGWNLDDKDTYFQRDAIFYEGLDLTDLSEKELDQFLINYNHRYLQNSKNKKIVINGDTDIPQQRQPFARISLTRDTPLFKREDDGTFSFAYMLEKEGLYRVYGTDGYMYNVGGHHYVLRQDYHMNHYVGRVMPAVEVPLYTANGDIHRMIRTNEAIRVYAYDDVNDRFEVGGGYYMENTKEVNYIVGLIRFEEDTPLYEEGKQVGTIPRTSKLFIEGLEDGKAYFPDGSYVMFDRSIMNFAKN
ncbi:hypothetical protein AB3N04_00440 (plasmid) [Alkalihalophilus sp. As8PL]|uniref:Uncharacterized protein n=1 Tax=Alkalihalophilus sp. As8PL TaxID=3237103 RepID=A0AB39BNA4_9BACI